MLVNEVSLEFFQSQGSLKQGDLFSSYLFIIVVEFLSSGLDYLYSQYSSIRYCTDAPVLISYLSFTDDIVFFLNKSGSSLMQLMNFLYHYEVILKQLIS